MDARSDRPDAVLALLGVMAVDPRCESAGARGAHRRCGLLGALSLVPLRRAVRRGAGRPLAAWAIVAGLALTTHYFALFLVAAEAIWLLRHAWEKRAAAIAVAAVTAVAVTLAPLAVPGAVLPAHRLDLELRRGRKPS
jgi:hypothetical protein